MATMHAEEYTEPTTYTPSPGTHMSGLAAIEKIKCRYIVNAAGAVTLPLHC